MNVQYVRRSNQTKLPLC